jgi:hypothetical protein
MKKKFVMLLVLSLLAGPGAFFGTGLPSAEAAVITTEQRYQHSRIIMVTQRNNATLYAEPSKDALVMGYYPKGTIFVPINQSRNETEGKTYNLVIRFDGAVGWLVSDDVVLSKR